MLTFLSLQTKESDINFVVAVRVTNQATHISSDFAFVPDAMPTSSITKSRSNVAQRFTEIYGDTFISGFIDGGELIAIVNVKVRDKSKTTEIKGALQAGYMGISAKGAADFSTLTASQDTNISISVYWNGGGIIKRSAS